MENMIPIVFHLGYVDGFSCHISKCGHKLEITQLLKNEEILPYPCEKPKSKVVRRKLTSRDDVNQSSQFSSLPSQKQRL